MRKRRTLILVGAGLTVLIMAALAVAWLTFWSRPSVGAPTSAESSIPATTPTPASTGMPSPTAAEVSILQEALDSGSDDQLRPIVGATPGQALSPDFATKLKALGIHFDSTPAKSIGGGSAWEEDATDASGAQWQVGLVQGESGQIEIAYAEKAQ